MPLVWDKATKFKLPSLVHDTTCLIWTYTVAFPGSHVTNDCQNELHDPCIQSQAQCQDYPKCLANLQSEQMEEPLNLNSRVILQIALSSFPVSVSQVTPYGSPSTGLCASSDTFSPFPKATLPSCTRRWPVTKSYLFFLWLGPLKFCPYGSS